MVGVVAHRAMAEEYTLTIHSREHTRVALVPQFGIACHLLYRRVVWEAHIEQHTVVVEHLEEELRQCLKITTSHSGVWMHTLIFPIFPAMAKNSPSLSNSMLETMLHKEGFWPP